MAAKIVGVTFEQNRQPGRQRLTMPRNVVRCMGLHDGEEVLLTVRLPDGSELRSTEKLTSGEEVNWHGIPLPSEKVLRITVERADST